MLDLPTLRIADPDQAPPPPPEVGQPGVLEWHDQHSKLVAVGRVIGANYHFHVFGTAIYLFDRSGPTVTAFPCAGVDLHKIHDRFSRSVIPLWLHVRGQPVLHASAAKMPPGVVALSAPPNTGKSTIAFALDRHGHPLWSDDAVPFRLPAAGAVAEPLPFFTRLRQPSAEHFGVDRRQVQRQEAWAALPPRQPEPLLAIYLLERLDDLDGDPVQLRRLPATEAFTSVLAQTLSFGFREQDLKRETMRQHLALVGRVPVYRLRYQTGLENLPAILDAIERTADPVPVAT